MYRNKSVADVAICGGGIRGMMSAIMLAEKGYDVILIESSSALGGVLNSISWKGYSLDIGCHFFDNAHRESTEMFYSMHKDFNEIRVKYQSVMSGGGLSDDMAQPDLTLLNSRKKNIFESLEFALASPDKKMAGNYKQYLIKRFGNYIATLLFDCVYKKTGLDSESLCYSAASAIAFDRVRLFDDQFSIKLKNQEKYDECIAVPSSVLMKGERSTQNCNSNRSFYPVSGGLASFCRSAEKYLSELGVRVIYRSRVERFDGENVYIDNGSCFQAKKIIWSNDLASLQGIVSDKNSLTEFLAPVAAVLIYFEVPADSISDITYLHDYRLSSPCFRISTAGLYSGQIINGNTYVCGEIFTSVGSECWNTDEESTEHVWSQMKELGVVTCEEPLDVKVIKAPSAYKLPLVGYIDESQRFMTQLAEQHPNLIASDKQFFSKHSIYDDVKRMIDVEIDCVE